MTELAQILRRISEGIYHPRVNSDDEDTVLAAMQLDTDLDRLQNDVTAVFNLNGVSLLESETTTKRKVLLKLSTSATNSNQSADLSIGYRVLPCPDSASPAYSTYVYFSKRHFTL